VGKNLDALFGLGEGEKEIAVVWLKPEEIRPYGGDKSRELGGHPYLVTEDQDMADLRERIRQNGIETPVRVRIHPDGRGYEMLSGHRRWTVASQLGLLIPAIIGNENDDDAALAMTDGNLHRSKILPSERAYSYKLSQDALKRKANRGDGRIDETLAGEEGKSRATIQRYIQLTRLCPELLDLVDANKLKMNAAEQLLHLSESDQKLVLDHLAAGGKIPNARQAKDIRILAEESLLDAATLLDVFSSHGETEKPVELDVERINSYFPMEYTVQQKQELIESLLIQWAKKQVS